MAGDEEGRSNASSLRHELLDPKIAEHHGCVVKTTGDGMLVESAKVDAVRCCLEGNYGTMTREPVPP
jgi:adenylate cyclase